jgi:hypothetical protein
MFLSMQGFDLPLETENDVSVFDLDQRQSLERCFICKDLESKQRSV